MSREQFKKYEEALDHAHEVIVDLENQVKELSQAPWQVVTAVQVNHEEHMVRFMHQGQVMENEIPMALRGQIQPGYELKVNPQTGAVVSANKVQVPMGEMAVVSEVHNKLGMAQVEVGGHNNLMQIPSNMKVEPGDRVVVGGNSIVMNMGKVDSRFVFTGQTNVSWDEIGGLEDAKQAMREAIELPIAHSDIYKRYGKAQPKGIVLYGPPGTGKTMLGKAAATAIAKLHGQEGSTGFIYVKGPEIFNAYVGQSEANVRGLFHMAREHQKEHGYPAVIFLDEADALLRKRVGDGRSGGTNVSDSVVNQFLAEMDGLESSGAIIIIATNRLDIIDGAILRDGRIDRKIKVDRPTYQAGQQIANIHLRNRPLTKGLTKKKASTFITKALYSEAHVLYDVALMDGSEHNYTLGDRIDGAMIAAVVEHAATFALRRDLNEGSFTGITVDDLKEGVSLVYNQTLQVDCDDEVMDFLMPVKDKVQAVSKRVTTN